MQIGSVSSGYSGIQSWSSSSRANQTVTKQQLEDFESQLESSSSNVPDALKNGIKDLIANFDSADSNGDGSLGIDEMMSYAQSQGLTGSSQASGNMPPPPPPGGQGGAGGGQEPPAMTKDQLTQMRDSIASSGGDTTTLDKVISSFSTADTDGDGKVSASEFKTYAEANNLQMPAPPSGSGDANCVSAVASSSGSSSSSSSDSSGSDSSSSNSSSTGLPDWLIQAFLGKYNAMSMFDGSAQSSNVNVSA